MVGNVTPSGSTAVFFKRSPGVAWRSPTAIELHPFGIQLAILSAEKSNSNQNRLLTFLIPLLGDKT
jgi:hypothetical protein